MPRNRKAQATPDVTPAPIAPPTPPAPAEEPKEEKKSRGTQIVELTAESCLARLANSDYVAQVKLSSTDSAFLLSTMPDVPGCYSFAIVKDGKLSEIGPAHVDRCKSDRHLGRALRLLGSYLGENVEGLSNGARQKKNRSLQNTLAEPVVAAPIVPPTPPAKEEKPGKGKDKPNKKK